jgi:hypothetical protein
MLEEQVAAAVEQLELQPCQLRQVVVAQRAIGVDQLAGDAAGIDQAQALQVLQDLLHRRVDLDTAAAVFARIGVGLFAQHLQQALASGRRGLKRTARASSSAGSSTLAPISTSTCGSLWRRWIRSRRARWWLA